MVDGCGCQDGAAGACARRPQRGGGQGHNRGVRTGPGRERTLSGIHIAVKKCVLSQRFAGALVPDFFLPLSTAQKTNCFSVLWTLSGIHLYSFEPRQNLFFLSDLLVLWIRILFCHLIMAQKNKVFSTVVVPDS